MTKNDRDPHGRQAAASSLGLCLKSRDPLRLIKHGEPAKGRNSTMRNVRERNRKSVFCIKLVSVFKNCTLAGWHGIWPVAVLSAGCPHRAIQWLPLWALEGAGWSVAKVSPGIGTVHGYCCVHVQFWASDSCEGEWRMREKQMCHREGRDLLWTQLGLSIDGVDVKCHDGGQPHPRVTHSSS